MPAQPASATSGMPPGRFPPAAATAARHLATGVATAHYPQPHRSGPGPARSPSRTHHPPCQRHRRIPSVDSGLHMGKMFFNILATFAEFEADLIRMRIREGMAVARVRGKLRGKQPKLSDRQLRELCRMHATDEYSISDLAELFSVSRPTVYRTLNRRHSP